MPLYEENNSEYLKPTINNLKNHKYKENLRWLHHIVAFPMLPTNTSFTICQL